MNRRLWIVFPVVDFMGQREESDPGAAWAQSTVWRLNSELATAAEIRIPAKKLPNYLSQRKPEDLCAYTMPLKVRLLACLHT